MILSILIVIIIVCLLMGVLTLLSDPRSLMNILAAVMDFMLSLWVVTVLIYTLTPSADIASLCTRAYFSLAAIFIALLVIFVSTFPVNDKPPRRLVIAVTTVCSLLVFGVVLPGFLTGQEFTGANGNCHTINNIPYLMYSAYIAVFFVSALYIVIHKLITTKIKAIKCQLKTYLIGIIIFVVPVVYFDLWVQYFSDCSLFWAGCLAVAAFVSAVSYGIIRQGMFDIRLTAVRTLTYILSLAALVAIYYGLVSLISIVVFGMNIGINNNPLSVVLALALLFIFQPIKKFFDRLTNKFFYRDYYNSAEFYARLNRIMISTTNIRRLLERVSTEIASTLKSEQVFFFINALHGHYMFAGTDNHIHFSKNDVIRMQIACAKKRGVIVVSLLDEDDPVYQFMTSNRIELILPLSKEGWVGYLCLGAHKTSRYTNRDIKVLNTVTDELVIAIHNTLSIDEVRRSNAELRQLDKAKDEFISVASHELRTPMTVIRGFINLLVSGQLGPINSEQKSALEKVTRNTKTLIDLVNDMLDLAKLEANKLDITLSDNRIDDLINASVDKMHVMFDAKGISLKYIGIDAMVKTDLEKFDRIMANILGNACKFTNKGGSTIVTSTENRQKHMLTVCVADTGVGIPQEAMDTLFKKFSQVDDYLQRQSDGTGLGLAICKQLVEKLGGTIWVKSTPGVGSEFYFTVPLSDTQTVQSVKSNH